MQRIFRLVETTSLSPMSVKPPDRLVQSVRQHGILSPVLLAERVDDDGVIDLVIVDGNRRVGAAKLARLEKIPAVVYQQADDDLLAALTVITNTLRSKNMVSEWKALELLRSAGQSDHQIAELTGLTAQSVRTRLRPASMPPVLQEAIERGKITPSTAEAIARLDLPAQQKVASEFERKGFVERADVDAVRPPRQAAPAPPMPRPDQPAPEDDRPAPVDEPWYDAEPQAPAGLAPADVADAATGLPPGATPPSPSTTPEPAPAEDDPRAFVARLDAALLSLARETQALELPRSVWVDRAMRAWELAEDE